MLGLLQHKNIHQTTNPESPIMPCNPDMACSLDASKYSGSDSGKMSYAKAVRGPQKKTTTMDSSNLYAYAPGCYGNDDGCYGDYVQLNEVHLSEFECYGNTNIATHGPEELCQKKCREYLGLVMDDSTDSGCSCPSCFHSDSHEDPDTSSSTHSKDMDLDHSGTAENLANYSEDEEGEDENAEDENEEIEEEDGACINCDNAENEEESNPVCSCNSDDEQCTQMQAKSAHSDYEYEDDDADNTMASFWELPPCPRKVKESTSEEEESDQEQDNGDSEDDGSENDQSDAESNKESDNGDLDSIETCDDGESCDEDNLPSVVPPRQVGINVQPSVGSYPSRQYMRQSGEHFGNSEDKWMTSFMTSQEKEAEEIFAMYASCTGVPQIKKGYAFPQDLPTDIDDIVQFWELDFQVGKRIVSRMGAWENLGLAPRRAQSAKDYERYMSYKVLYLKWVHCNKDQEQWYRKYGWRSLQSVLTHLARPTKLYPHQCKPLQKRKKKSRKVPGFLFSEDTSLSTEMNLESDHKETGILESCSQAALDRTISSESVHISPLC